MGRQDGKLQERSGQLAATAPSLPDTNGLGVTVIKVRSWEVGLTTETELVKAALLYADHVTLVSTNAIHVASGASNLRPPELPDVPDLFQPASIWRPQSMSDDPLEVMLENADAHDLAAAAHAGVLSIPA